jgi:N-acetyl-gamma-glutamyl-phosphate reductase
MFKIFIDGEAGTTGLLIKAQLKREAAFEVLAIEASQRKDVQAKRALMAEADLVVLCLADEQARESVALIHSLGADAPKVVDASSAHRTQSPWVYGFPELCPEQEGLIAQASWVSNPGCYATGAIALLRPLLDAGVLSPDAGVALPSVSGYSGGGRSMIESYEQGHAPLMEYYALGLEHKHVPEIMRYSGLERRPLFVPSVGNFAQGMVVQLPLHREQFQKPVNRGVLLDLFAQHYERLPYSEVKVQRETPSRLDATALNGTNRLEIEVATHESSGQCLMLARLDNLGKGASGAAVQNIRLMLGLARNHQA